MFVRTFVVALVIAIAAVSVADAQLFRSRLSRFANPQANCPNQSRYRTNLAPITRQQACQQQRLAQQQLAQQQKARQAGNQKDSNRQIRVVTYYDPSTGRLFQRSYYVPMDAAEKDATAKQQTKANKAEKLATINRQPADSATADAGRVRQTALEAPVNESKPAKEQYSVFEADRIGNTAPANNATSVIESDLPVLELPAAQPEPGSIKDLELDLPALDSPGKE